MKFYLLMLICCVTSAFSTEGLAQPALISMNLKNAAIESVLNHIEETTNYHFLYNKQQVDVVRRINIEVENQSIQKVLDRLFNGTDVEYSINNRQIVLSKSTDKPQQQSIAAHKLTGVVVDSNGEVIMYE